MCIFECWETPKPLQNHEPTVSASYKRSPLQNQEPALSISLQALRLSKKMVLANPGGPDNGVGILGGIQKIIRIYSACSWLFLLLFFYSSCTLQYAKRLHHVSLVCRKCRSFPRLLHNSTSIIILWKACNFRLKSLSQLLLLLLSSSTALKNLISLVT